jgi:dihydrofolate reductase
MRRVRYVVAMSLDGYIAGPNGEVDWITTDPDFDFGELFSQFDTLLVGRRTFETMVKAGRAVTPGMKTFVFSRTLQASDYPGVDIVTGKPEKTITALRATPGKDIWLFGGGLLFRSLAAAGLVDAVEAAVMPVLLGGGTPLLPSPAQRVNLKLTGHAVAKTGVISLKYSLT